MAAVWALRWRQGLAATWVVAGTVTCADFRPRGTSGNPGAGSARTDTNGSARTEEYDVVRVVATESDIATGADAANPPAAAYDGPACTMNKHCYSADLTKPYCMKGTQRCVQCLLAAHCAEGKQCEGGVCKVVECTPGSQACTDSFLQVCNPDGQSYTVESCPNAAPMCVDGGCKVCKPGATYCAAPGVGQVGSTHLMKCDAEGNQANVQETCSPGTTCMNKKCLACQPETKTCDGDKAVVCAADGLGNIVVEDCGAQGFWCLAGLCIDPCGTNSRISTNDCVVWAVDLEAAQWGGDGGNGSGAAQTVPFAAVLWNHHAESAQVKVTGPGGQTKTYVAEAGNHLVVGLPLAEWNLSPPVQVGSGISKNAYRLDFTRPMAAMQFKPYGGGGPGSAGATRLFGKDLMGKEYWVVGRPQNDAFLRSYLAIVTVGETKTEVSVLAASKTKSGPGVPAMEAGQKKTLSLQHGQVLTLATDGIGADLTGTWIKADRPIAVFSGSTAAHVPDTDRCVAGKCVGQGWSCTADAQCPKTCCADHMQAQLAPVSQWGDQHVAARFQPRGKAKDVWRILAQSNDTVVTTDPPQTPIPKLAQGKWVDFESDQDFVITANHPIQVVQFMAGMFAPGPDNDTCSAKYFGKPVCKSWLEGSATAVAQCSKDLDCGNVLQPDDAGTGGPEMVAVPPVDHWSSLAAGISPAGFDAQFVTVVGKSDAKVQFDGKPMITGQFDKITNDYKVARVSTTPGAHKISGDSPVLVVFHGWTKGTSYAYVAGGGL